MHHILYAFVLFFVAAPSYSNGIAPYNLLIATKNNQTSYFLPTIHQSNQIMHNRMKETLRCLPEIGAIVTETSLADIKKFSLLRYSIIENKKLRHVLSPDLVSRLDDLSDKVLPRAYPRKFASAANQHGIHPAHFLSILKSRVDLYILLQRGWDLTGPSFESILHSYAVENRIGERYLEAVDSAAAAHMTIAPAQIVAQANYLLRLFDDRKMQYQVYIAADNMNEVFKTGDWTASNIQKLNAALRAGQSGGYVAAVAVRRTKDMLTRLESLPRLTKPPLVAIGMGHFGKIDGVEAVLAARGYSLRYGTSGCPLSVR